MSRATWLLCSLSVAGCFIWFACEAGTSPDVPDAVHAVDAPGDDVTNPPSPCDAMAATCLASQQSCTVDAETGTARCELCPRGEAPTAPSASCAPIGGIPHTHDFGELSLSPGEEVPSVCRTWVLNNPKEMWIHAVEFENGGGYHHSNWLFVPEDYKDYPGDLWYDCYAEGFHEVDAGLAGGVLYAQSTQVMREVQKFEDGIAIRIPPYSRIIAPTHLLNYQPVALTTGLKLTIYEVPAESVVTKLAPLLLTNRSMKIKPGTTAEYRADCDFEDSFTTFFEGPMAVDLHYVLPHYHDKAVGFSLSIFGGDRAGEILYATEGYAQDPVGRLFNPPISLAGAQGLTFSCTYKNETSKTVKWGIGNHEMCDMLGFIASPASLIGFVDENVPGVVVDGISIHDGDCEGLAVEFDQTKGDGASRRRE